MALRNVPVALRNTRTSSTVIGLPQTVVSTSLMFIRPVLPGLLSGLGSGPLSRPLLRKSSKVELKTVSTSATRTPLNRAWKL